MKVKKVKRVGMVHLKGVNDKEYEAFVNAQKKVKIKVIPSINQW
tara:strand:- start:709 stop:840 length:132 start_codon:yes stop_codon:yes gene_type:complete